MDESRRSTTAQPQPNGAGRMGLVGSVVRVGEARVGTVSAVIVDAVEERALGLEVTAPDGRRWFVPWIACTPSRSEVVCASPLVFLPESELAFYVDRGTRLTEAELQTVMIMPEGGVQSHSAALQGVSAAAAAGTRRK